MMEWDDTIYDAVRVSMRRNIPFAVYAMPGEDRFRFIASPPSEDTVENRVAPGEDDCFAINFFNNDEHYTAGVRPLLTAAEVASLEGAEGEFPGADIPMSVRSTSRLQYLDSTRRIIASLRRNGGKTVVSRMLALTTDQRVMGIARRFFDCYPSTFRYICFTQETGFWMGASPELLLDADNGRLSTMSLAGTRSASVAGEWDPKNIEEHDMVTDFIADTLRAHGLEPSVGAMHELGFGTLVHLCNDITAEYQSGFDLSSLLYDLSPTPAVAGLPRRRALDEIEGAEIHDRLCYGGFVAVTEDGRLRAFVNLRCARFSPRYTPGLTAETGALFNLYAGGGVTGRSVAEHEWNEAGSKLERLAMIIGGDVDKIGYIDYPEEIVTEVL